MPGSECVRVSGRIRFHERLSLYRYKLKRFFHEQICAENEAPRGEMKHFRITHRLTGQTRAGDWSLAGGGFPSPPPTD